MVHLKTYNFIILLNNNYIDAATGFTTFIRAGTDNAIAIVPNGAVELYYDNSIRLKTASAGLEFHNLTAGSGNSDLRYNSLTGAVFFDTSTILVKTNIENVPYGLDTLNKLQPRIYERTDCNNEVELGFIAEEVDKLIPEIVPKIEGKPVNVDYRKISVVLTKAVQELAAKVAALEAA